MSHKHFKSIQKSFQSRLSTLFSISGPRDSLVSHFKNCNVKNKDVLYKMSFEFVLRNEYIRDFRAEK